MSTKTIAVENSVYERLARVRKPSESFTKTISRILDAATAPTCAAAVREASAVWGTAETDSDADRMEQIIRQNRAGTDWSVEQPS